MTWKGVTKCYILFYYIFGRKLVVTENCVSVNLYIVANPKNVTINGSETEGANEVAFDLQVYIKEPEMSIIETVPVSFTIE